MAQVITRLKGFQDNRELATPQHSADYWLSEDTRLLVSKSAVGKCILSTDKGDYVLTKHDSQNYYMGTCNKVKVHIILRPMVGKIIHWS